MPLHAHAACSCWCTHHFITPSLSTTHSQTGCVCGGGRSRGVWRAYVCVVCAAKQQHPKKHTFFPVSGYSACCSAWPTQPVGPTIGSACMPARTHTHLPCSCTPPRRSLSLMHCEGVCGRARWGVCVLALLFLVQSHRGVRGVCPTGQRPRSRPTKTFQDCARQRPGRRPGPMGRPVTERGDGPPMRICFPFSLSLSLPCGHTHTYTTQGMGATAPMRPQPPTVGDCRSLWGAGVGRRTPPPTTHTYHHTHMQQP